MTLKRLKLRKFIFTCNLSYNIPLRTWSVIFLLGNVLSTWAKSYIHLRSPDSAPLTCQHSSFVQNGMPPVSFSVKDYIYNLPEKRCQWHFIGVQTCKAVISCDTENLKRGCDDEYLEVVDGHRGFQKFCPGGGEEEGLKVERLKARDGMRDLFMRFHFNSKPDKEIVGNRLFNCSVKCEEEGEVAEELPAEFEPKVTEECLCGIKPIQSRIIGGKKTHLFEFPFLVALVVPNTRTPFCGGSIINSRFVLTAAHCFQSKYDFSQIQVVIHGGHLDKTQNPAVMIFAQQTIREYSRQDLDKMDQSNGSVRVNVTEILLHPQYVYGEYDYDVALVKLDRDLDLVPKRWGFIHGQEIDFTVIPRAVCLPNTGRYEEDRWVGQMATSSGWGLVGELYGDTSHHLMKADLQVFPEMECNEMYRSSRRWTANKRMLCAGHKLGHVDTCTGDSGGPLFLWNKDQLWTQIGVVSWGEGCARVNQPSVNFKTTESVQWIKYVSNYDTPKGNVGPGSNDDGALWCDRPD